MGEAQSEEEVLGITITVYLPQVREGTQMEPEAPHDIFIACAASRLAVREPQTIFLALERRSQGETVVSRERGHWRTLKAVLVYSNLW